MEIPLPNVLFPETDKTADVSKTLPKHFQEQQKFKADLLLQLRVMCQAFKRKNNGRISEAEGYEIANYIDLVFRDLTDSIPNEVRGAYNLAMVFIASDVHTAIQLLKGVFTIIGGTVAIASIIGGIGAALGWGAGMIATVIAWFTGTSMTGPLGWIAGGVSLAVIIGYFWSVDTAPIRSSKFQKALLAGIDKAINASWDQYADRLVARLQDGETMNDILKVSK